MSESVCEQLSAFKVILNVSNQTPKHLCDNLAILGTIADMEQLTSLLDSLSLSQDRLAVLESVRPALGKLSR